jgi:hypothetical protein
MWNFLVLGIIPGTDIQIDLGQWLLLTAATALVAYLFRDMAKKIRSNPLPPTISSESNN